MCDCCGCTDCCGCANCCCDCCAVGGECKICKCCKLNVKFRPLAFILGLPFISISFNFSIIGAIFWLIGSLLECICPCKCVKRLVGFAMWMLKVPFLVMNWFVEKIGC